MALTLRYRVDRRAACRAQRSHSARQIGIVGVNPCINPSSMLRYPSNLSISVVIIGDSVADSVADPVVSRRLSRQTATQSPTSRRLGFCASYEKIKYRAINTYVRYVPTIRDLAVL